MVGKVLTIVLLNYMTFLLKLSRCLTAVKLSNQLNKEALVELKSTEENHSLLIFLLKYSLYTYTDSQIDNRRRRIQSKPFNYSYYFIIISKLQS